MRLSSCQSVFSASSIFLIYFSSSSTYLFQLSQASHADTILHEDHNHHRLPSLFGEPDTSQNRQIREGNYEPDFLGLNKGIVGRAAEDFTPLANNAPLPMDIKPGDIQYWSFPKTILRDPRVRPTLDVPLNLTTSNTTCLEEDLNQLAATQRMTPSTRTVWLTLSICDRPTSTTAGNTLAPPQLEAFVSRSSSNKRPDSGRSDQIIAVTDGYGNLTLSSVTDDLWIGVKAPQQLNGFDGSYSYELVASVDAPYATYFDLNPKFNSTEITAWDTDSNSAILWTGDITNALSNWTVFSEWMEKKPPPFQIYVYDETDPVVGGISRSVCGLKKHAKVKDSNNTMIRIGGQPKQQFYVTDLNSSSSYMATMTLESKSSNLTVGGGGTVWRATNFTTKSDATCQIVYNLPFCTDVAYAVPSNPKFANKLTQLALTYDTWAHDAYQNFDKSLQQIPCNTTPSAQYSLARNCDDCANAYKTWLCAVTIPRCEDFSAPPDKSHLLARSVSASRNPKINTEIGPGPYKEMLPCKDLCYHLTQSCPAALQFACPLEGRGLNESYGHQPKGNTQWYCNWPGGPNLYNGAEILRIGWGMLGLVLGVAMYVS